MLAKFGLVSLAMFALAGCGVSGTTPAPTLGCETDPGNVCAEFDGRTYVAYAAQVEPTQTSGASSLTIPAGTMTQIGEVSSINADIGRSELTVYQIRNVDPTEAVAIFAGHPGATELYVLVREELDPRAVKGLCNFYIDTALQRCLEATPTAGA